METFSASLAFCVWNSPVTGDFPLQRPMTWSFDVFFDLRLNQQLSEQWRRRGHLRHHHVHCEVILMLKQLEIVFTYITEGDSSNTARCQRDSNSGEDFFPKALKALLKKRETKVACMPANRSVFLTTLLLFKMRWFWQSIWIFPLKLGTFRMYQPSSYWVYHRVVNKALT